jgi:hypothetical protein
MATALAAAAIVSSLAAPVVSARPVEQFIPAAAENVSYSSTAPPPSSIAASAAEEYEELRSAGAVAAESLPVADEPSPASGFDLPSAAIGAAAGTGLALALFAAAGLARRLSAGATS